MDRQEHLAVASKECKERVIEEADRPPQRVMRGKRAGA
jgi:hypothetical protein